MCLITLVDLALGNVVLGNFVSGFWLGELARGGWGNLMGGVPGGCGGVHVLAPAYKLKSKNPISKA